MSAVESFPKDAAPFAVAWVHPPRGDNSDQTGLWRFDSEGKPTQQLARLPDFVPSGSGCSVSAMLQPVGDTAVAVDIRSRCKKKMLPGTPTGALLLIQPSADRPERLALQQLAPAAGEEISWAISVPDIDGDSTEDVTLRATLRGPSKQSESLDFSWLDRPAGLSRVQTTPIKELGTRSRRLAISGVRKKEREAAVGQIDSLRRLVFALCGETKTEKVQMADGTALSCGSLAPAMHRLSEAALEAHLGMKAPWLALGEYERADRYVSPVAAELRKKWSTRLLDVLDSRGARRAHTLPLHISVQEPYPVGSPLRFDAEGSLWATTADGSVELLLPSRGTTRVAGAGGASPGPEPWPRRPRSKMGRMLEAAVPSCDRSEVQLVLNTNGGSGRTTIPLPLLAPRPGGCTTLTGRPLSAEPVFWRGNSLLAIVMGQPVATAGKLGPPKAPLAWATSLGIARWSRERFELWETKEADGASHCVANDDASAVACVLKGAAVVFTPED